MSKDVQHYPKPGELGGALIRKVIAFLKSQKIELPITSHILIAVSGGSDSVGLAHLLVHFGRRIAPRSQISLLHINHGWRGKESDDDQKFVEDLGRGWKIPVKAVRLAPPQSTEGESWEEKARVARKKIFALEAKNQNTWILTAHQADDVAETLLWRLFTGAAQTHGGGVAFRYDHEIRPLLTVRKSEILDYLKEVGQSFREDSTNSSGRFMRSRMRSGLMPEVEKLFPRAVEHLSSLALVAQGKRFDVNGQTEQAEPYEILFHASGLKARRPHFELISEKLVANKSWCGEIHLPGGWRLIREKVNYEPSIGPPCERWVLERGYAHRTV